MGVQARKGSDRLRTIWTPEMDRYCIDLMLEQIEEGNRVDDRLFSKRAWKHMASLFNTKFKFQYENDVLKNRHKTLRNLYRAITNLIDQEGFSWDEKRQMVIADNKVWDDYIKLHPDARSYRIKTIPYYSDLCKIYKHANIEGKCRLSDQNANVNSSVGFPSAHLNDERPSNGWIEQSTDSCGNIAMAIIQANSVGEATVEALHDIMLDEDYRVTVSEGTVNDALQHTANICSAMGTRSRTYWQPPMDRYFIDLMLDQVQKGNQIDGQFKKKVWMEMMESFSARFGFRYDVGILKNRYKTLRRQHNVIKNILELDGFVWDDTRQMVIADNCIWQDYIKAHTDAKQYMTRPVLYFKDLCVICKDLNVDGRDVASGNNLRQQDEAPETKFGPELKGSHSPAVTVSSEGHVGDEHESSHTGSKTAMVDQKNKRQIEEDQSLAHAKKVKVKDEGMASAIREMATAVSSFADKRKNDNSNSVSIEIVIEAIQALPNMDEDLVLDACDLLEDEKKAKTFLALDVKLRKKWLIRKLRSQLH